MFFVYYQRGGFHKGQILPFTVCHSPTKYKILKKYKDTTEDEKEHFDYKNLIETNGKKSWCSNDFILEAQRTIERIRSGELTKYENS